MKILYVIFFLGVAAERLNILSFAYWGILVGLAAFVIALALIIELFRGG